MNIQFAVVADQVFVLEVNPRASRTVPFVAKATGVPIAKIAVQVVDGASAGRLRAHREASAVHGSEGGGVSSSHGWPAPIHCSGRRCAPRER